MINKAKGIFSHSNNENIILAGSSFDGSIVTEGSIRVFGEVSGTSVKADKVYLKPGARMKVHLEVNNLFVEGIFMGEVKAAIRVILSSTAKVFGNVITKELLMSEGVEFQGNCKVSQGDTGDIGKHIQELYSQKESLE